MSKQLQMLEDALDVITRYEGCTLGEAYEKLVHFAAYELSVDPGIVSPTFKYDEWEDIRKVVNFDVLREDKWDWFGELAHSLNRPSIPSFFVDRSTADAAAKRHYKPGTPKIAQTILDPHCGSGGLILALHSLVGNSFIYYGADHDLTAYRTALVNMKLYGVNAKVVHLNSETHKVDPGSRNWQYANMWTPPDEKKASRELKAAN